MSSSAATAEAPAPRALQAFTAALERGRLAHAVLVQGGRLPALEAAALGLAAKLLGTNDPARHPDFFTLRPAGKARFIKVDALRDFLRQVNLTASAGPRKVGMIYEVDRMPAASANAFLKTLEEPPAGTTLFLLTTRPHDLLPTIRSRCFHLRLPDAAAPLGDADWKVWREDYAAWLGRLAASAAGEKIAAGEMVFGACGLGARFEAILARLADTAWEAQKERLPPDLEDEEAEALRTGLHKGARAGLLVEIEQATRDFALADPGGPDVAARALRLGRALADLEKTAGLLEVNLKETDALEFFLLRSLRHWTAKG